MRAETSPSRSTFTARLESGGEGGAWTLVRIPADVQQDLGVSARIAVRGTINGYGFRSSIFPDGDVRIMMVNRAMQQGAGAVSGDTVRVVIEPDSLPRTVTVPADLARAFTRSPAARENFDGLSYSHRKAYVEWIEEAKRVETRQRRIEKAIDMLTEGRKLKG
jgi:hypothetical protein